MTHANLDSKKEVSVTVKITIAGLETVYGKIFSCKELCWLHKKLVNTKVIFYETPLQKI